MRLRLFILALAVASIQSSFAEDNSIEPGKFQLEVTQGADARYAVTDDGKDGQKAVKVEVTKLGPEFWNVELRAAGINFEPSKTYEVKFQAKAAVKEYIYVVPEKADGNQASVAEGTTLQIPTDWTECTVVFKTTDRANPGRLNISNLSSNPDTFWFSDFRITSQ
jgi:Carbohydrate binding domain